MENLQIQIANAIKALGKMENNMEKVFPLFLMVLKERENRKMIIFYIG
jgi:hypothetical protein